MTTYDLIAKKLEPAPPLDSPGEIRIPIIASHP
jgi:hypothetical protein